jgi:hypothetical protein
VYRGGLQVGQTATTSYTDTGLIDGATYSYFVVAYDAAGNVSVPSSSVSATPLAATPLAAAPANTSVPTISGSPTQGQVLASSPGSWSGNSISYTYAWQDCDSVGGGCTVISGPSGSTYTLGSTDVNHTIRLVVRASNSGGSVSASSAPTAVVTAPATNQTLNCFPSPGACGFPDPAYSNVGVRNCAALTPFSSSNLPSGTYWSGSGNLLQIVSPNVTLNGYNFGNWSIYISSGANNFTLNNSCINYNGSGLYATQAVSAAAGVTGTLIENSTIAGANNTNQAAGALVNISNGTINNVYLYNSSDPVGLGPNTTLENSYVLDNAMTTGPSGPSHNEDVYYANAQGVTIYHNTLLNIENQTAVVFGDSNPSCSNGLTFTNNLAAGGGYMFYTCGSATSVGTSTMNISNNNFARCTSGTCPDSHGYYPGGGYFGVDAWSYCPSISGQTWSANVWDDNGATVSCS